MSKLKKAPARTTEKKNALPLLAGAVALIAIAVVLLPKVSQKSPDPAGEGDAALFANGQDVVVQTAGLGQDAQYYRYDANGTTVELFAIKAPDGSVRLALNTCQVCNGSPYAYFVQEKDQFICQNCKNRFSAAQIGLAGGGCNPVPITGKSYTSDNGAIVVPSAFLEENAPKFKNWKQF